MVFKTTIEIKSRSDDTLLTVDFNLRTGGYGGYYTKSRRDDTMINEKPLFTVHFFKCRRCATSRLYAQFHTPAVKTAG